MQVIVETTAQRVVRLCERRGLLEEGNPDPLYEQEPLLATLTAASVQGTVATGERAGQRVRRRLLDPQDGVRTADLCYASRGFSLHAATRIDGPTAPASSTSAATSFDRPWPQASSRSSTPRRSLSP